MATRHPPRKKREDRQKREARRRAGETVIPPPPPPPPPAPPLARAAATGVTVGAAAGGSTFLGGSAAAMFGITATGEAAAGLIEGTIKALLSTLRRIAALRLARQKQALQAQGYAPEPIEKALAEERRREREFQRRSAERVRAALSLASLAPDASARAAGAESALRREQNYARQRAIASGERVFAAIGQQALEEQSPLGAFWKLGIAAQHTPDCVAMAEKFWPWEVLRRIHPLLHVGCKCRLYSYGEAIAAGWMTPAAVMDLAAAQKLAQPVIEWVERHHLAENEALAELLIREELVRIPGADLNFLAAAPLAADVIFEEEKPEDPEPDPEPADE